MDWTAWRAHFEANTARTLPDLRHAAHALDPGHMAPMTATLVRLHAGETGEGRIVQQFRRSGIGDADYQACLAMFVAEEGRHAAILGRALRALGGRPNHDTWTARAFGRGRGVIGPRTKLMILQAAEVIAVGFYGAMAQALPEGPLERVFADICADEVAHLEFHCDFFAHELGGRAMRQAYRAAWWPTATACCGTVLLDHSDTLGALGISRRALAREMGRLVAYTAARVCDGAAPRWRPRATLAA